MVPEQTPLLKHSSCALVLKRLGTMIVQDISQFCYHKADTLSDSLSCLHAACATSFPLLQATETAGTSNEALHSSKS
jgi:hypothetical protein